MKLTLYDKCAHYYGYDCEGLNFCRLNKKSKKNQCKLFKKIKGQKIV